MKLIVKMSCLKEEVLKYICFFYIWLYNTIYMHINVLCAHKGCHSSGLVILKYKNETDPHYGRFGKPYI